MTSVSRRPTTAVARTNRGGVLALALACLSTVAAVAQAQPRAETLVLRAFPLRYQPVEDAAALVAPLLSERGSLSLQREDKTLVVRDRASVIATLEKVVAEFDHQPRIVRLHFYLLRARRAEGGSASARAVDLPQSVASALGSMLNFNDYQLLGQARVFVLEGEEGEARLGSEHAVKFHVGTILRERRLPLRGFEVSRGPRGSAQRVIATDLLLKDDKSFLLTISSDVASAQGLVLAMDWRRQSQVSPAVPDGAR